ncbi:MAG: hypothetical protein N2446_02010 [Elusimicrobiales bacterium]|nr:hypothetical protein [Elusimicrobiales bacterium]
MSQIINNLIDNLIELSLKAREDIINGITPNTLKEIEEIYKLLSLAKEKLNEINNIEIDEYISKKILKLKKIIEINQELINYQINTTNKIIKRLRGNNTYSEIIKQKVVN